MRYFILNTYTDDEAATCLKCNIPEIVRCKDCKYSRKHGCEDIFGKQLYVCQRASLEDKELLYGDWFCAGGERG